MTDRPPSPQTRRRVDPGAGSTRISVFVRDEQDDPEGRPVDERRWEALCAAVLEDQGLDSGELSVTFVSERVIADLNRRFLGNDGPTDVLSFPLDDATTDPDPRDAPLRLLGDIVICPAVAARNAPDHAGTYDDEIALLLVHGVLHVLGMDHELEKDREQMQHRERELLSLYYDALARDPWS